MQALLLFPFFQCLKNGVSQTDGVGVTQTEGDGVSQTDFEVVEMGVGWCWAKGVCGCSCEE